MSRITKTIAEAVAKQLVQEKNNELKEIKKQKEVLVREFYLDSLPKGILDSFKKFNKYFAATSSIYLNGPGLTQTYKNYKIGDSLPSTRNDRLTLNAKAAELVIELDNKEEEKQTEINNLLKSIEVALINLRTYNNVEKQFPEAFKLLPETAVNTAIMVNIKDIRCKLDKANC